MQSPKVCAHIDAHLVIPGRASLGFSWTGGRHVTSRSEIRCQLFLWNPANRFLVNAISKAKHYRARRMGNGQIAELSRLNIYLELIVAVLEGANGSTCGIHE